MKAQVLSIFGGKGGVGKSLVAANFAVILHQETNAPVLLLDLDTNGAGDQEILFGAQKHGMTLAGLSKVPSQWEDLAPALQKQASGVTLLTAHRDRAQQQNLTPEWIEGTLKVAKTHFPYILIDSGSTFDECILRAFAQSACIFVVTNPELLAIHQTKRALEKIQSYLFSKEMIRIVINKMQERSAITPEMVQKNLGFPIFSLLAEDTEGTSGSLMRGVPLAVLNPRSLFVKSLHLFLYTIREQKLFERLALIQKPTTLGVQESEPQKEKSANSERRLYIRAARHDIENDPVVELKLRIHKQLTEVMDLKQLKPSEAYAPKQQAMLREKTKIAVVNILDKEPAAQQLIPGREERTRVVKEILDEALGLGALEDFLKDPSITEIMVNRKDQIYIERRGRLELTSARFVSDAQLLGVIERIVTPLGRRIDEKCPYVDARLPDGSRVHAIIPPLAIQGPTLTIRKFAKEVFTCRDLVQLGSVSPEMARFFKACIEAKLNIIVSGGTSSGKTSLLNALSAFIPASERIITVEDSAELQLSQPHICRLEARPANIEGEGAIAIRDLVKNTLRMRPDRIIVGECRSAEAIDMLQAMNTGHDGSLTTIHANSPRDCLSRLETLIMMAELDLPSRAIREQISAAVHLIIQASRLSDGSRRVVSITEVVGMEGDKITLQDLFLFKQEGIDGNGKAKGKFIATGMIPRFYEKFMSRGIDLPRDVFLKSA